MQPEIEEFEASDFLPDPEYILPENCPTRYIHIKGENQENVFKESDI